MKAGSFVVVDFVVVDFEPIDFVVVDFEPIDFVAVVFLGGEDRLPVAAHADVPTTADRRTHVVNVHMAAFGRRVRPTVTSGIVTPLERELLQQVTIQVVGENRPGIRDSQPANLVDFIIGHEPTRTIR